MMRALRLETRGTCYDLVVGPDPLDERPGALLIAWPAMGIVVQVPPGPDLPWARNQLRRLYGQKLSPVDREVLLNVATNWR